MATKGGKKQRFDEATEDLHEVVFGEEAQQPPSKAVRRGTDKGWRCGRPFRSEWRGLNGENTRTDFAPDLKVLDFYGGISSGMFGTLSDPDQEHIERVCPGLVS